jgi:hypothetical protein
MRGARYRSCLLLLVAGLLVVPLPAAADGPPAGVIVWGCRSGADPAPCNVPAAAATGVTAIAAGLVHSLALKLDGSVIAWGCPASDDYGQCTVPAAVRSGVTAISAGLAHSLAVKKGGVIAWGCKGAAFGDPTDDGQCTVPAAAASGVTAVAAGASHSLALRKDGRVVAWGCAGSADRGQCTVPAAARSGVTAIAAGLFHSLALKNGGVLAWGCGGSNPATCAVPAAAASGVTAIAAGPFHSLALKDGGVLAWGCGFGIDAGQCSVPPAATSGVTAIAAGSAHSLALKNGGVLAWGCDRSGVNPAPCTVPAAAAGGVSAIAAAGLSLSLFAHLEQTITVVRHAPPKATYKQSFTVAASSSSGLPVAYGSSGACSNAGASFTMKSGTGRCRVRYDQPGGGSFGTARVVESVSARKAAQRIRFGALAGKTYGTADFRVRASASSGLRVSFAARGSCTVRGTTVHITSAGSCTLTASQRGNANYNAAASVSQSFTIARGTP